MPDVLLAGSIGRLSAASSVASTARIPVLQADGTLVTGTPDQISTGASAVDGPASSTDNAVARFDSTTGKLIQNSVVIADDSGNITLGDGTTGLTITETARPTDANGTTLTIKASNATPTTATNRSGGQLILSGGNSTGTGTSSVAFHAAAAGGSGSSANAVAEVARFTGSSRLGLGVTSPSYDVSMANSANRAIGVEDTTTDAVGRPILIQAGSAPAVTATNRAGGSITIAGGSSTGTATSSVVIQTAPAGSSGTTANTSATVATFNSAAGLTMALTGGTLVLKQGANSKTGTFTLNGATPVSVSNTSITANSGILITLKTVGGTVSPSAPNVQTITASTGFDVAGTAGDTSVYNYHIIESAA